jgi:hypothetical protein
MTTPEKKYRIVPRTAPVVKKNDESAEGEGIESGSGDEVMSVSTKMKSAGFVMDSEDATGMYTCSSCKIVFKSRTMCAGHEQYCNKLASLRTNKPNKRDIIRTVEEDALVPTPKELFLFLQQLTLKYNKMEEELTEMKKWAKRVAAASSGAIPAFSVARNRKLAAEEQLNETLIMPNTHDATFTAWYERMRATPALLDHVFATDLVTGIVNMIEFHIASTLACGTEVPIKAFESKQGMFYVFEIVHATGAGQLVSSHEDADTAQSAMAQPARKWRALETTEFNQFVNYVHKQLLQQFKVWQDENWEAQKQQHMRRQHVQDRIHAMSTGGGGGCGSDEEENAEEEDGVNSGSYLVNYLTEEFSALYNRNVDKITGGSMTTETVISRVRAKLWKLMG